MLNPLGGDVVSHAVTIVPSEVSTFRQNPRADDSVIGVAGERDASRVLEGTRVWYAFEISKFRFC
jgi:hypothetical protein